MRDWKRRAVTAVVAVGAFAATAGTASAETATYFNANTIQLREYNPDLLPTPSFITVGAHEGPITDVDLNVNGIDIASLRTLQLLLVSPAGDSEVAMSFNCSDTNVANRFVTFDQSAAALMPYYGDGSCPGDTYRPSDGIPSQQNTFEGLPGGPTYTNNFDNFDNENANGLWRLYAFKHCGGSTCAATDQIEGGWSIRIETGSPGLDLPGGSATFGPASPYPQTVTRYGAGLITDVNVHVNGVFHSRPDDIDMVLEKVGGPSVMLMSDACGSFDVNAYGWVFDDEAPAQMPDEGTTDICGTTAHRPTNRTGPDGAESLPAPAPPAPYATSLSVFDLTPAAGEYRLWVRDDGIGDEGFITTPFDVIFQARANAATAFATPTLEVSEGDTDELTVRRSGANAYGAATVQVKSAPGTAGPADFEPISATLAFEPGETEETVQVRALADGETEPAETFTVNLSAPTGDAAPSRTAATVSIRSSGTPPDGAASDRTPPETEITKQPRKRTGARTAKFAFTASEPGSTFECKLDKRPFKACESPTKLERLRPGRHRFLVRATDAAGNTDSTPAKARWRIGSTNTSRGG